MRRLGTRQYVRQLLSEAIRVAAGPGAVAALAEPEAQRGEQHHQTDRLNDLHVSE